jgi:hypothetical protein
MHRLRNPAAGQTTTFVIGSALPLIVVLLLFYARRATSIIRIGVIVPT